MCARADGSVTQMSKQPETILGDKVRVMSRTGSTQKFVWEFEENKSRVLNEKDRFWSSQAWGERAPDGAARVGGQMNKTA